MSENLASRILSSSTVMRMRDATEFPSSDCNKTGNFPTFTKIRNGIFPEPATGKNDSRLLEETDPLNLQPGEWAQIRSIDEISATLDENGRNFGLYFMPEMEEFCEKRYRVFKKAAIIKLESTGEVRRLRSPAVLLEGVYCNGERHEGCDRACFHFWREAWLKRVSDV